MRPPFSFPRKKTGVARPKERRFPLRASSSKKCGACRLHCLRGSIATLAANGFAIRFASAPTIRCRSANLSQVQPNHHLPMVRISRRASAMPPWQAEARLMKSEVDGNCVRLPIRRQSDSEDRSKPSRLDTKLGRHFHSGGIKVVQNRGCQSDAFLLDGHTARFLSTERKWGVWCCGAHAA